MQEVNYVDHLYLQKSSLDALILLAYGETLRTGKNTPAKDNTLKRRKISTLQHSWLLFYVTDGKGVLFNDKEKFSLQAGDLYIVPPFAEYMVQAEKGEKLENIYLCIYDTKVMAAIGAFLAVSVCGVLHFSGEKACAIREELAKIKECILNAAPGKRTEETISLLCYKIFYFLEHHQASSGNKKLTFEELLKRMKAAPSRKYTCESMAQMLQKDRRTLTRLFLKHTAMPPIHFLTALRLDHAAKLLQKGAGFSMENIAASCGYKSISAFAASFWKKFHLTPAQYRKKYSIHLLKGGKRDPRNGFSTEKERQ